MKKFLKVTAVILLSLLVVVAAMFFTYLILTKNAILDCNKLTGAGQNVIIFDDEGNEVINASLSEQKKSVKVNKLQQYTINAFIASEDRTFFKHNGLNYKRMLKALYKNIVSGSFKEGASTISQQLIKNTHLSNDKTIRRKLNEIKLTRQLENKYDKNNILEMYLNTIYFGHNCYGLQSAAMFYFDKKAENLNLAESATLVGLLTSPNNFSPLKNPEKSLKRRNIVLKSMLDCKYINEKTYAETVTTPLNTVRSTTENAYDSYINAIFDELEEINFDYYRLADNCIIKTYLNAHTQNLIESLNYPCDNAVIITDNITGGVKAYKTTINGANRQPGSTVKPIFVYAPAFEEKIFSPFTKITDEKSDFNGYSPENYDKKYHGNVTVTESLKNSYNIPAVKTLNMLTIKQCEKYLSAMDIRLDDDEKNLSIALGGMKYGLNIKEIADKYSIFPHGGNYRPSRFIKEIITKSGDVLYRNNTLSNKVYSEGTCSLINDILIETAKSGTAKKLKEFKFDIAAKTGTCGNAEGNTDAYAAAYTSRDCFAVWLGDKDNKRSEITGGTDCCKILKILLEDIYSNSAPAPLDTTSGTETINIDREEYNENDKIVLADPVGPKLNILSVKVLKGNIPPVNDRFSRPKIAMPSISVSDRTVNILLCQTKYYAYLINRKINNRTEVIYDGKWVKNISDAPGDGVFTYTVTPYYDNGEKIFYGDEIILPSVNLTKNYDDKIKIPDIAHKDWFNQ